MFRFFLNTVITDVIEHPSAYISFFLVFGFAEIGIRRLLDDRFKKKEQRREPVDMGPASQIDPPIAYTVSNYSPTISVTHSHLLENSSSGLVTMDNDEALYTYEVYFNEKKLVIKRKDSIPPPSGDICNNPVPSFIFQGNFIFNEDFIEKIKPFVVKKKGNKVLSKEELGLGDI